jgi:hypothetical protein
MARIEDLEFRITATTDTLRADLARGNQQIDQFASRTGRQFNELGNRFTMVAGKLRSLFALFGIGFGVRALSGWVKSAFEIDKLTQSQADRLKGIKSSMETLNASTDHLVQTIGFKLLPYLERAASFYANMAERADSSNFDNQIAKLQETITARQEALIALRSGQSFPMRGTAEQARARLEAEIADLQRQRAALEDQGPQARARTLGQERAAREAARLQEITVRGRATSFADLLRRPTGMNAMPSMDFLLQNMTAPSRVSSFSEMIKRPAGMNAMPTAGEIQKITDAWKKQTDAMDDAKRKQEDFAVAFAATFESRGMEALLDGDVSSAVRGFVSDLAQLILRMKVLQPLAESIGGAFSAKGGFFASLFGGKGGGAAGGASLAAIEGWRAGGGPVDAGKVYGVGERGKEWFVPDVAGRIMTGSQMAAAGGGVVVNQSFYTAAGLPPQWEANLITVGNRAASEAYKAVTSRLGGRR